MGRCRLSGQLRIRQRLPGRMARAGRRPAPPSRPENRAGRGAGRPAHPGVRRDGVGKKLLAAVAGLRYSIRRPRNSAGRQSWFSSIAFLMLLVCGGPPAAAAATEIVSARLWPAEEYTRLTLESEAPITHHVFTIAGPDRLVLDLEEVDANAAIEGLPAKVSFDDPYVSGISIGRFKPGMVRLVLDLKTQVKPQTFILEPVGEYGYRLVLDIYPAEPVDPIVALLEDNKPAVVPAPTSATPPAADNPDAETADSK